MECKVVDGVLEGKDNLKFTWYWGTLFGAVIPTLAPGLRELDVPLNGGRGSKGRTLDIEGVRILRLRYGRKSRLGGIGARQSLRRIMIPRVFRTGLGKLDCLPRDAFYRIRLSYKDTAMLSWRNDWAFALFVGSIS